MELFCFFFRDKRSTCFYIKCFQMFHPKKTQVDQVATCNYSFLFSFCFEVFVACLVIYVGYEQLLLPWFKNLRDASLCRQGGFFPEVQGQGSTKKNSGERVAVQGLKFPS